MVTLNTVPGCVEGLKLKVTAKNIVPSIPRKVHDKNHDPIMVFCLSAKENARTAITQEYDPKEYKFCSRAHLDVGDEVHGKHLSGFSASPLKKITPGGEARSGKHPNQKTEINGSCCFMEIVSDWHSESLKIRTVDRLKIAESPN